MQSCEDWMQFDIVLLSTISYYRPWLLHVATVSDIAAAVNWPIQNPRGGNHRSAKVTYLVVLPAYSISLSSIVALHAPYTGAKVGLYTAPVSPIDVYREGVATQACAVRADSQIFGASTGRKNSASVVLAPTMLLP
jgi:hypothetical protein